MRDDETFAEYVAAPLRAPEYVGATFTARVLETIRATAPSAVTPGVEPVSPPPRARRGGGEAPHAWWRRSVTLRVTPLGAFALAAGIAGVMLVATTVRRATPAPGPALAAAPRVAPPEVLHDTTYVVRFVLMAPSASSVVLVGDFNNWDRGATRLTPTRRNGVWTASVALPPGQHEYAFIVNGTRWTSDPNATLTVADDFGTESSIVTVGARGPSPTS